MDHVRRRPRLIPLPFAGWDSLALAASVLPTPPLTDGQVARMKLDDIALPDLPGLGRILTKCEPEAAKFIRWLTTSAEMIHAGCKERR